MRSSIYKRPPKPYGPPRRPYTKLSADSVRAIRTAYSEGEKQIVLALQFDVTQSAISLIVNRKQWKDVS